jgi:DNA invertase Pin-like site-specific DNA recombinase
MSDVRSAICYLRLSTNEQKHKSTWSLEAQYDLKRLAQEHGYDDDRIIIEDRDLGISGTKGRDKRPGLAHMIDLIEAGKVGAVYVIHISRISRDQTLIDGLAFGELCRKNAVRIVMPHMTLDLRDKMHLRMYRMEIERSADEIELLRLRMGGPKRMKARSGRYDGRSVAPGYIVDNDESSPTREKYILYEPHAQVVRRVFNTMLHEHTYQRVTRKLNQDGVIFPDFGPDVAPRDVSRSSLVRRQNLHRCPGGFRLTPRSVKSIVTNPVYLGWWVLEGQVVREDNHIPIVDDSTFWVIQERLNRRARGVILPESRHPQMLSGLVWCGLHQIPLQMSSSRSSKGYYRCDRELQMGSSSCTCSIVASRILEEPVAELVLATMGFTDYADAVLARLQCREKEAKAESKRKNKQRQRLNQEIETLKSNLKYARTEEQNHIIWDEIEKCHESLQQIGGIGDAEASALTPEQITTVRGFLQDLRSGWDRQPVALQNELMKLLLQRVIVKAGDDYVAAEVTLAGGNTVCLEIERPPTAKANKLQWSEEDNNWLRRCYAQATVADISTQFPSRNYTAIRKQATSLGLKASVRRYTRSPSWTEEENRILRDNVVGKVSNADLRTMLAHRTADAIDTQRSKLGIVGAPRKIWYRIVEPILEMRDCVSSSTVEGHTITGNAERPRGMRGLSACWPI